MKTVKLIGFILLTAFSVAYCHYASDVLFTDRFASSGRDVLQKEYFDSLIVGFCAAVPSVLGTYFYNKRKIA